MRLRAGGATTTDARSARVLPHPARFAVHKLLVAQERAAAFQAKSLKDVAQAAVLVTALEELRPGDLRQAIAEARGRGKGWRDALGRGVTRLRSFDARAAELVENTIS